MDMLHGHDELSFPAGEFKQRRLALLEGVAETGVPIVVTKRGRPVARVVPISPPVDALRGSVQVLTEEDQDLFSTGEAEVVW